MEIGRLIALNPPQKKKKKKPPGEKTKPLVVRQVEADPERKRKIQTHYPKKKQEKEWNSACLRGKR